MTEMVLGFIFNYVQDQVALLRKNRPAWQAGHLNGVGGHIEPDEMPVDAMVREAREKVGLETSASAWHLFARMERMAGATPFRCYVAWIVIPTRHLWCCLTATEDQPVVIVDPRNLPARVLSNLRWLIPMAMDLQPNDGEAYVVRAAIAHEMNEERWGGKLPEARP